MQTIRFVKFVTCLMWPNFINLTCFTTNELSVLHTWILLQDFNKYFNVCVHDSVIEHTHVAKNTFIVN